MMTLGLLRILKSVRLKYVFAAAYGLIFILSFFSSSDFIAIAFDASGATTGAVTVPFMLALAGGISAMKSERSGEADTRTCWHFCPRSDFRCSDNWPYIRVKS